VTQLAAEIEALEAYMSVQRARFGPQLRFDVAADAAARAHPLPSFLLQPLVENAVKHGRRADRQHEITVEAALEGDCLRVRVENGGRLRPDWESEEGAGVGLANIRRRLALHYPGRHGFTLRQQGDRVTAEISLLGSPCAG